MIKQAKQWFATHKHWFGEGTPPVHISLANRRADVCIDRCDKHTTSVLEPLMETANEMARRVFAYKQHLKLYVDRESELHVCGVCDCALKTLVWTPIDSIVAGKGHDELAKLPPHCWQLTEAAKL